MAKWSMARMRCFALLINAIIPLGGMNTDIYLPSLPAMSHYFGADKTIVQLTVAAYVFGMGLGQLLAGPVSDAVGRKKQLLAALLFQVIAVIAILLCHDINWVIGWRVVQGVGAAFMMVPARAVVNDCFTGDALKKQFNYLTISFAMGPIVAPFIGGYLQHYFGWQANFYFVGIYAVCMLLFVLLLLPETISKKTPFSPMHLVHNYRTILSSPLFVVGSILAGMAFSYSVLFSVAGPFMVQVALHRSAVFYGHIALLMGVAWFAGNMLNRFLFDMVLSVRVRIALFLMFLVTAVMTGMGISGVFSLWALVVPIFLMIMLGAILFSAFLAEVLHLFPKMAASTNAASFSIVWLCFGVYSVIATFLKASSLLPIALVYLVITLIAVCLYFFGFTRLHKSA